MKKIYIYCLILASIFSSCEDFLNLESKTDITNNYLTSVDGIKRSVAALYNIDRTIIGDEQNSLFVVTMMDYQTDISVFRGGTSATMFNIDKLTPSTSEFNVFWTLNYKIIGKCNEIITNAEAIGIENNTEVKHAWGEAKFFRGRSYFELWKRFERLYLNLEPTNISNLDRECRPSTKDEIFAVIRKDLDDAIEALEWELPQGMVSEQYGRVTKGVAMHVRSQVAMWDKDWDKVISLCEEIFSHPEYHKMEEKLENVFLKDENLRSKEVLMAYQFSKNLGGGGSGTPLKGHTLSLITTAQFRSISGCTITAEDGGYSWGRLYPNEYLLSLYDKEKDSRYSTMYRHNYQYNDPNDKRYGQTIDPSKYKSVYLNHLHPMCKKYFDSWTNKDQPDRRSSFRDVIRYRLGETALMLCEAYFYKEGGTSTNALKYYNMTWERAGNNKEMGPLDINKIIDEYARECNFEGVRWSLLKRLGILGERVKAHAGESMKENPFLNKDYIKPRENFIIGKHEIWPIPQTQIDLMGGESIFPQNNGWK